MPKSFRDTVQQSRSVRNSSVFRAKLRKNSSGISNFEIITVFLQLSILVDYSAMRGHSLSQVAKTLPKFHDASEVKEEIAVSSELTKSVSKKFQPSCSFELALQAEGVCPDDLFVKKSVFPKFESEVGKFNLCNKRDFVQNDASYDIFKQLCNQQPKPPSKIRTAEITSDDLLCLGATDEYVNDEVINEYLRILKEKTKTNTLILSSHTLSNMDYDNLHITKLCTKHCLFDFEHILIPIHVRKVHWALLIANINNKTIMFLDSLNYKCDEKTEKPLMFLRFLFDHHLNHKGDAITNLSGWKLYQQSFKNELQSNGTDCGVFTMMFAECLCNGMTVNMAKQIHCQYYRRYVACTIIKGAYQNDQVPSPLQKTQDPIEDSSWKVCELIEGYTLIDAVTNGLTDIGHSVLTSTDIINMLRKYISTNGELILDTLLATSTTKKRKLTSKELRPSKLGEMVEKIQAAYNSNLHMNILVAMLNVRIELHQEETGKQSTYSSQNSILKPLDQFKNSNQHCIVLTMDEDVRFKASAKIQMDSTSSCVEIKQECVEIKQERL